jgi:hypothetical protein
MPVKQQTDESGSPILIEEDKQKTKADAPFLRVGNSSSFSDISDVSDSTYTLFLTLLREGGDGAEKITTPITLGQV